MHEASIALGEPLQEIAVLGRDAGGRSYARATTARGRSLMILEASAVTPESMARFWRVARVLDRAGVRVPRCVASVPGRDLSVITDLGPETLCDCLRRAPMTAPPISAVIEPLEKMAAIEPKAIDGTYDPAARLRGFAEIFIPAARETGWSPPSRLPALLELVSRRCEELSPQGLVHADFHSRNIVIDQENRIGVVDFQDAAYGPVAVDWAAIAYDHNRSPHPGAIGPWEGGIVDVFGELIPRAVTLRSLRWAGLFWHLRLAGACTRLLRHFGSGRFGEELRAVGRWLLVLAGLPELEEHQELVRDVAGATHRVAGEA